jgi:hypothetical protein
MISRKLTLTILSVLIFLGCTKNTIDCKSDELIEKEIPIYSIKTSDNLVFDETIRSSLQKNPSGQQNFIIASKETKDGYHIYIEELRPWKIDIYYCNGIINYKKHFYFILGDFPNELLEIKTPCSKYKVKYRRFLDRETINESIIDDSFLFWNYLYKDGDFVLLDTTCMVNAHQYY